MIPTLRKPKRTLRQVQSLYLKKASTLELSAKELLEKQMEELRSAILKKNRKEAKKLAEDLQEKANTLMPKSFFEKLLSSVGGLGFALLVAVLIRTMWFELYVIPSGSMRPTLKEDDYLVVSKTDFSLNVPLQEKHFYFDKDLVQRGSIVVFNGANIDLEDADTVYFYLFPGKKQFVKRLIGKPGDTIYFYGGKLYGLDANANPIDFGAANTIEHVPFIRLDGRVDAFNPTSGVFTGATFLQMNQPVARLNATAIRTISPELTQPVSQYSDYLGIKHFAMARLLTKKEAEKFHPGESLTDASYYLELTHHPKTQGATLGLDEHYRVRPQLNVSYSLLPLEKRHLQEIQKSMTTCRFVVQDEMAYRVGYNPRQLMRYLPKLSVPNGTYEIQDGVAYRLPFPNLPLIGVFTNGITQKLHSEHALYSEELVPTLFNLGIEWITSYQPNAKDQKALPSRYAYFKNGDLYLMGHPVILKDDPILTAFTMREKQKELSSTSFHPYFAFADSGEPSAAEIAQNGVRVPEGKYLVLGDNHAMSADSRHFGFVPEENLKGAVSFLFSPPGERWGKPAQPFSSFFTLPNLLVWSIFLLTLSLTSIYYRKKLSKSIYEK